MKSYYHKVFYHLYKLAIQSGETSVPLSSVIPTLAFLQIANVFCFFIVLDLVGLRVLTEFLTSKNMTACLVILAIIFMGVNYFYFSNQGRDKKLVKEFSKRPIEERKRGARMTLIYALTSIVLIFILAPIRVKLI
ncbi:hypothetical protein [Reichenbachiella versicolor]|uniref:hypothetical protein n=1 Tax=Reichenbachiella versicolor TaxID=1821036 RepID=UPI000D6E2329|nr:hypothetical protein [Reichenbachiella versicolor]